MAEGDASARAGRADLGAGLGSEMRVEVGKKISANHQKADLKGRGLEAPQ